LVAEGKDIFEEPDWDYHLFDDDLIKGMSFFPAGSEAVFLTVWKVARNYFTKK
jgi:hypothetical protein